MDEFERGWAFYMYNGMGFGMEFPKFKSLLCIILVFVCHVTYFFQYFENEPFEKNIPKII